MNSDCTLQLSVMFDHPLMTLHITFFTAGLVKSGAVDMSVCKQEPM